MQEDGILFAQRILHDAGGELTGRVRLQKIVFFMCEAGFVKASDLAFKYYHYGPYSETLAENVQQACAEEIVKEDIRLTDWGTDYSIYKLANGEKIETDSQERAFVQTAKALPSVLLELAATALYLCKYEPFIKGGRGNLWAETERRKKFKAANGRLRQAYEVYEKLRKLPVKTELPEIPFLF